MKFFIAILITCSLCFSCEESKSDISTNIIDNGAQISIIGEDVFNFGEIIQGEKVDIEFNIKNTGQGDLIISDVNTTCGCTVPSWPRNNIKKGTTEKIRITFNSQGKKGIQTKKVTLITNATPSTKILTITGTVIVPKN